MGLGVRPLLREHDVTPVHTRTYLLESASRHPTGQPDPRPQVGSCHVRRRVRLGQADVVRAPNFASGEYGIFCLRFRGAAWWMKLTHTWWRMPITVLTSRAHTSGGRFTARTGFMHCAEFDGFGAAEQFLSNSTRRLTEYCITGPFG